MSTNTVASTVAFSLSPADSLRTSLTDLPKPLGTLPPPPPPTALAAAPAPGGLTVSSVGMVKPGEAPLFKGTQPMANPKNVYRPRRAHPEPSGVAFPGRPAAAANSLPVGPIPPLPAVFAPAPAGGAPLMTVVYALPPTATAVPQMLGTPFPGFAPQAPNLLLPPGYGAPLQPQIATFGAPLLHGLQYPATYLH